jgi:N,N'-diacetyl-8-epilegionaminate cytidylyltransferase
MTSPYVLGAIFARGGSKRVPGKNIRPLAGKPLIAYSIETARASRFIQRVIVSTEDAQIADVARQYGADVPFMRPAELARDDVTAWAAWQHAISALANDHAIDAVVAIPPTSPLRAVEDVDACIQSLLESDADIVITIKPAERNPYFNMVQVDEAGYARLIIPTDNTTRQSVPDVYDMTTVAYAARPDFIMRAKSLWEGRVKSVTVPVERAVDIDTELDFQFAEFLLTKRFY